jgi:hypothetical protein
MSGGSVPQRYSFVLFGPPTEGGFPMSGSDRIN